METSTNHNGKLYQEEINLELFSEIVSETASRLAIMDAKRNAENDSPQQIRQTLPPKPFWDVCPSNVGIEEKYGFRYLGELVERYENKLGDGIRHTRAVALAIAHAWRQITDDMHNANQISDFLKKAESLSDGDVYLKAALYTIARKEDKDLPPHQNLGTETEYARTEELLFVLPLFNDINDAIGAFKQQLSRLLGNGRTIPVAGNMHVYVWLAMVLRGYYEKYGMRGKDFALLRAFAELPAAFVKPGNKYHAVMLNNGYDAEEIALLNGMMIHEMPTSDTVMQGSIVAEKIAIEACKALLSGENEHHQDTYDYLVWLLNRYESFDIKITGYKGICDAIQDMIKSGEITIRHPVTLIFLHGRLSQKNIFRFDIMDDKWDILSSKLTPKEYLNLFEAQLLASPEHDGSQIREWIGRYDALTGTQYLSAFEVRPYHEGSHAFNMLVWKGVINLMEVLGRIGEQAAVNGSHEGLQSINLLTYLRSYIEGVKSREAFGFVKAFLEKHGIGGLQRMLSIRESTHSYQYEFTSSFYEYVNNSYNPRRGYTPNHYRLVIKRDFLSDDEHRELLGWIDDYVFNYRTDKYLELVAMVLINDLAASLYSEAELRGAFDAIVRSGDELVERYIHMLKEKYLTDSEKEDEEKAKEVEEKAKGIEELKNELIEEYNGTAKSLCDFADSYRYNFNNSNEAMSVVAGHIDTMLDDNGHVLATKEFARFLQLCGHLIEKGSISCDWAMERITKIKEGEQNDAEDD